MNADADAQKTDLSLKFLAVLIAVVVWMVAASERNRSTPITTFDAVVQAPVTFRNLGENLEVVDSPASVSVRLRGPRELESASMDSVSAPCNMAKLGEGQHLVAPEIAVPAGFEVVRVPAKINVTLESHVSRMMDVQAPEGMTPVPSQVSIEGRASLVNQVRKVVAIPSDNFAAAAMPVDDHGQAVFGVRVYPNAVGIEQMGSLEPLRIGEPVEEETEPSELLIEHSPQ